MAKRTAVAKKKGALRKLAPAAPDVRRVPTQERSKQRLERILDAADQVFAEVGYDAATTEQIAERAETSIGSLYQFFPNKSALFEALCQSYLERARVLFENLLADPALGGLANGEISRPWQDVVDDIIEAFWRFHVDQPGFRAVWVHQNISAQMIAAGDAVNQAIAARGEQVLALFAPDVPRARRRIAASIVVETISAILFVSIRRDEDEAKRLVAELKRMVRGYLSTILPPDLTSRA